VLYGGNVGMGAFHGVAYSAAAVASHILRKSLELLCGLLRAACCVHQLHFMPPVVVRFLYFFVCTYR